MVTLSAAWFGGTLVIIAAAIYVSFPGDDIKTGKGRDMETGEAILKARLRASIERFHARAAECADPVRAAHFQECARASQRMLDRLLEWD